MSFEKIAKDNQWPEMPDRPYFMHGWHRHENKEEMQRLLFGVKNPLIVELGCWLGLSAKWFLETFQDANVITVDTFEGSIELLPDENAQEIIANGLYDQAVRNLYEYKDRLVILQMRSVDGIKYLHGQGINPDLVYIDASHQYEDARNDIKYSLECFPNAIICGDDFKWYSVKRALREFDDNYDIYNNESFWWIEK